MNYQYKEYYNTNQFEDINFKVINTKINNFYRK